MAEGHSAGWGHDRLTRIERGNLALWQATTADAQARITAASLGNGVSVTRGYNANTGRQSSGLVSRQGTTVLQEGYNYDALGNVLQRTQNWGGSSFIEEFTYDLLNRLKTSTITGQAQQVFDYDDIGNLTSKTGVGIYTYPSAGSVRPHAVTGIAAGSITYDANGNMLTAPGRGTPWSWTSFDMPARATKGSAYSDFVYGPDHQRLRQSRSDGKVIYYAGASETEMQGTTVNSIKTTWPMGLGVEIESNGATSLNWTHLDRLGSVSAITDETGAIKERMAYDAWGNRRNLDALGMPIASVNFDKFRGFTGHEMLDPLGLVHMNGRVYDPLVARFTSADTQIQEPTHSQSYNRYSYVWNNPATLTDPSGFTATVPVTGKLLPSSCGMTCTQLSEEASRVLNRYVKPLAKTAARTYGRPLLIWGGRLGGGLAGGGLAGVCTAATSGGCAGVAPWLIRMGYAGGGAFGVYAAEQLEEALDASSGGGTNSEESKGIDQGALPKPPTGPGSVPKDERDPQRYFDPESREQKRAEQGNKCANGCRTTIDGSNSAGHHVTRHADGGRTVPENHAEVCLECHKDLHRK